MTANSTDKQALVTGGGSGLGLATAQRLAADGAVVTICGRTEAKLKPALESLPDDGALRGLRRTRRRVGARRGRAWPAEGGGLHIAVANAGTGTVGPITTTELVAWNAVMETNLTGVFLTFKHAGARDRAAPAAARWSRSRRSPARSRIATWAPYCVSKAAVEMLVKNTADEMGMVGVRVNAVRPGLVPTDLSVGLTTNPYIQADYLEQMPLGRNGTPEDIAEAVRYLVGPESAWTTGQIIAVDGGHTLRRGPDMHGLMEQVGRRRGRAHDAARRLTWRTIPKSRRWPARSGVASSRSTRSRTSPRRARPRSTPSA